LISQFDQRPQRIDFYLLEQLQQQAARNLERSRKRILLPAEAVAVTNLVPVQSHEARLAVLERARLAENLHQGFLFILLTIAASLLALRKFVPEYNEYMDRLLNPSAFAAAADFECSTIALEEEKSFAAFRDRFRVGPIAPGMAAARFDGGEVAGERFTTALRHIECLQKLVQEARISTVEIEQRRVLRQVYEKIQPLKDLMAHPELLPLEPMICALEPLLKKLHEKAGNVTSSSLRTVTQGVELLATLCQPGARRELLGALPLRFLVVDDETFSRFALATALKRTLTAPDLAENGETAMELASRHTYDLIFLDVVMPGMDGFELCSKIHETPLNRQTPVVFVTSLRDFDSRAKSIVCGGRDLISKPFLVFELTVKTLTLAMHERLHGRGGVAGVAMGTAKNEEVPVATTTPGAFPLEGDCLPVQGNVPGTAKNHADPTNGKSPEALPQALPPGSDDSTASFAFKSELATPAPTSKTALAFRLQAGIQATGLRALVDQILRCENQEAQKELIPNLLLGAHSLAVGADACRQHSLGQITGALEGLVKKLLQNPKNVTDSTLQAVTAAVSLIQELCVIDPGLDQAISQPISVLAVDDDPLARRFMTNALQLKFFLPQNAADGSTAVELASQQHFDVIFLDVQMPGLDGFAVCQQIRQSDTNPRTPVVFVTSNGDSSVRARARDHGAADFITKPYICSELTLKTITIAFRNRIRNPGTSVKGLPLPEFFSRTEAIARGLQLGLVRVAGPG
jgi:CheY-like chemotaxis protein